MLVGPSGAGKSTLLGVLLGLIEVTEGSVEVLGTRLEGLTGRPLRTHRSNVGSVGQDPELAGRLAVVHNVNAGRLGRWRTPVALASLVRARGRDDVAEVLTTVGLSDKLFARTDTLSGGERQRVAVARVLHQQPRLILADEPTSSVDPRLSDDIMGLLCVPAPSGQAAGAGERPTVVASVHEPDLARRHGTRIVGLREGEIFFDSTAEGVDDDALTELYRAS